MRTCPFFRITLLAGITVFAFLMIPGELLACEICTNPVFTDGMSWCRPVRQEETGYTICRDEVTVLGTYCMEESGIFCSVVDAGGGGGGSNAGGGGTNPCQTSGFCPAQCFSCSGWGRPAV